MINMMYLGKYGAACYFCVLQLAPSYALILTK